jgi:hypothetical protein
MCHQVRDVSAFVWNWIRLAFRIIRKRRRRSSSSNRRRMMIDKKY